MWKFVSWEFFYKVGSTGYKFYNKLTFHRIFDSDDPHIFVVSAKYTPWN